MQYKFQLFSLTIVKTFPLWINIYLYNLNLSQLEYSLKILLS